MRDFDDYDIEQYEDDRPLQDDERELFEQDCSERAQDMQQEFRSMK